MIVGRLVSEREFGIGVGDHVRDRAVQHLGPGCGQLVYRFRVRRFDCDEAAALTDHMPRGKQFDALGQRQTLFCELGDRRRMVFCFPGNQVSHALVTCRKLACSSGLVSFCAAKSSSWARVRPWMARRYEGNPSRARAVVPAARQALYCCRTAPDFSATVRLWATRNAQSGGTGTGRTASGSNSMSEAQPVCEASEAA